MFAILKYVRKLPSLDAFPLTAYHADFSLDHLVPGVDNVRYDVHLSPTFCNATAKIAAQLIARHAGIQQRSSDQHSVGWAKEVDKFKQLYKEVMIDAVNRAKGHQQIQIEYLAQIAAIKMLLDQVRSQFENVVGKVKSKVRKTELTSRSDPAEGHKLKGKLTRLRQSREAVVQRVGQEICGFWADVQQNDICPMREAIFGKVPSFCQDLLANPVLHAENPFNEFFMLAEYDLSLGRRLEDPDKYETLLFFIRHLLNLVDLAGAKAPIGTVEQRLKVPPADSEDGEVISQEDYTRKIDALVRQPENVDRLMNWSATRVEYRRMRKEKADPRALADTARLIRRQKRLQRFFYRQLLRNGLIERIAASYEMQPEYLEYCPPLVPQQILQYLVSPKSRKVVKNRLKRLKKVYGRSFSLRPLHKKIKQMEQMTVARRKAYMLRYLHAFSTFHRDVSNYEMASEAMERINPATEEKVISLSRANRTLYEFLLPHERSAEKSPVINHVVIKADVRGSTDITFQMNERGLNPASYFSLNFFDPISEILDEYDAVKVFIEGDAIILAIFERENMPAGWYAVARACGIALNMLMIIRRYNEKSKKFQLPILELGIGISFRDKAPAFLFDGSNQIMISPAINLADRLSGCSKIVRRQLGDSTGPFNLYVYQSRSDEEMARTADDLYLRYNVNGIELSAAGFSKLSQEIDLKVMPADRIKPKDASNTFYAGKFPTKSGHYQILVIRESRAPVVDPDTLKPLRTSSHHYYEVCTHPQLYKLARQLSS